MANLQMEVIPKPEEGSASVVVLSKAGPYPILRGGGEDNYLCGACRNVVCEHAEQGEVANLVFKCPQCGSYNRIRGTLSRLKIT